MLELLLGTLLAVAGLAFVLAPLVRGHATADAVAPLAPESPREASAVDALREIEFDQATGKLSDEDYAALKAQYTPRALAELRAHEAAADAADARAAAGDDPAERLIQQVKSARNVCPACGPRPEGDALFCSNCGRAL